jgi:hypothetical protein
MKPSLVNRSLLVRAIIALVVLSAAGGCSGGFASFESGGEEPYGVDQDDPREVNPRDEEIATWAAESD